MTELLDVNIIRNDPEAIRTMLRNRTYSEEVLDQFLEMDAAWRSSVDEGNRLRKQRNEASMRISKLSGPEKAKAVEEMKAVATRIGELDVVIADLEKKRDDTILLIPNIPDGSVPIGDNPDKNVVVSECGKERKFDFQTKDHIVLCEELDIVDFQRGVKIAGSGFYVLKGDGARMERALINYMLDLHHRQGYTEVFPPVVVNRSAVIGTGQYPKMKDDMYWCERDDLWLNPTAEVPVTNLHQDDILAKEDLPIFYTAYLPSFRREAGRHVGEKGMIRVHEFNKVELVKFVLPDGSFQELESLTNDAQDVLRGLELPFRTLLLCTGDMGFASAKTYDLEAHAPGTGSWLEVSSCSCFTDFQARRARIKYRPEPHLKSEFVHTLNGSGLALPRTMVAIIENNQDGQGRISIPKVIRPYMQGQELIE
ncbi:MAG: serine--tRNA ligase [Methanomassiliicoccales archaeon]|nr:serine--tRNA ligase [Methanomassiliicoccales archaeon]